MVAVVMSVVNLDPLDDDTILRMTRAIEEAEFNAMLKKLGLTVEKLEKSDDEASKVLSKANRVRRVEDPVELEEPEE